MVEEPGGRLAASPFVGRTWELDQLLSALDDATAGRGRVVVLAGEPGIGKSRLTDEFARAAKEAGAGVIWGRCWEGGGAPPFWPWVQAIGGLLREVDDRDLPELVGSGASDLAQIVPQLRERLPDIAEPPAVDPESARFRLFQAIAEVLRRAGRHRPTVLILEDLQSADTPSLLMLRFVAGDVSDARVALVATYRSTDLTPDHPLTEAVTELARIPWSRQLVLAGLSDDDLRALVTSVSGGAAPEELAGVIARETEGNPLFAGEILRLLASENRLADAAGHATLAIPQGVREVIGRRLLRLSDECTNALTLAAVLGRDFPLEAVRRLSERTTEEPLEALDEATAARVVVEVPGAVGWMRFSHGLIREALYEDLSPAQRMRLHRAAGVALEEMYAAAPEAHLAELAYHFSRAAPAGEAAKAVRYAHAAGDRALEQLAYEEADRQYAVALQTQELEPPVDRALRCELLVARGEALGRAGDLEASRRSFLEGAELARSLGLPEPLARAALGYGGRFVWGRGTSEPNIIPLLRDALEALGDADHPLRVRVGARLACALRSDADPAPRETLAREAVDMAHRLGDPSTIAYALEGLWGALWSPDTLQERLGLIREIYRWAEIARDRERTLGAEQAEAMVALEIGDLAAMQGRRSRAMAAELGQPAHLWFAAAVEFLAALAEGRLDDAEERMERARREGTGSASWDAHSAFEMHRFLLRGERGELAEGMADLERAAGEYGGVYAMHFAAVAVARSRLGVGDRGRSIVERFAADGFGSIHRDNEWIFTLALFAEVARDLAARRAGQTLYELLHPFADRAVFGPSEGYTGSLERYLGMLAAMLGRLDDACAHLERAVAFDERSGAPVWAAWSRYELARARLDRDAPGDAEAAGELLAEAAATAERAGLRALSERIGALTGSGLDTGAAVEPVPPDAGAAVEGALPAGLRREGEYWTLTFQGEAFRLRGSKGLAYLARLVAEPRREFHALDLVAEGAPAGGSDIARGRASQDLDGVDAGEGVGAALDARAKQEYRTRIEDLESDIAEAEHDGDAARAERARTEREAITRELAAAVGLGGRDRPEGSAAERARLNVTRALRAAVGRIAEHSAALGTHLDRSLRTGTFCSYEPDPHTRVDWRL